MIRATVNVVFWIVLVYSIERLTVKAEKLRGDYVLLLLVLHIAFLSEYLICVFENFYLYLIFRFILHLLNSCRH